MNFRTCMLSCNMTLLLMVAFSCTAQKTDISVNLFEQALTDKKVQLLDVRTAAEYETGHLKNALQANWNNEAEFQKRVKALDKNIPVYTYCLSGARSGAAVQWLNANGYTAYNMQGGIKNWNNAGKPLDKKIDVPQMSMAAYLQQIPADKTVLVDFGAQWCPPCKKMDPILNDLQQTHAGKFILVKIDGGLQTDLVKEMKIEEFPTFIVYKNGKPVWQKTGLLTAGELASQL